VSGIGTMSLPNTLTGFHIEPVTLALPCHLLLG
jgi:hypothetical protein